MSKLSKSINRPQIIEGEQLLTRDQFRTKTFERDRHMCVFCKVPTDEPLFAHHIMERRLFGNGGYYLSNGATVCNTHHLECEMTTITLDQVRDACGITKYTIPEHLYRDVVYDKWGNICQTNGTRLKGDLFNDPSVQKILGMGGVLGSFIDRVKYPRTYHLPWSPGATSDDRILPNMDTFIGRRVIVTEKMDGENTSMGLDYFHARSVDSANHPSRNLAKAFWGSICGDIPPGWRICGENLFAKHSIYYDNLPSYFIGFSVWDHTNHALIWDETLEYFDLLGITPPPILYDGIYDEQIIKNIPKQYDWNDNEHEGYVVRIADSFHYSQFKQSVGKFVRANHVSADQHWMHGKKIIQNKLKQ